MLVHFRVDVVVQGGRIRYWRRLGKLNGRLTDAPGLLLPLGDAATAEDVRDALVKPRLERAIGVIYRPENELASHYFEAVLPQQFDEYIWIDRTRAVRPLDVNELEGLPDTYPFGL